MTPIMRFGAVAMLCVILALFTMAVMAASLTCTFDASGKTTVTITNVCDHFVIWRTSANAFEVVCPGGVPPFGAVELREYYKFNVFGGTSH